MTKTSEPSQEVVIKPIICNGLKDIPKVCPKCHTKTKWQTIDEVITESIKKVLRDFMIDK